MDFDKIKVNKHYTYFTPSSSGRFKVSALEVDSRNSSWVTGFDKDKQKHISVRPAQVYLK